MNRIALTVGLTAVVAFAAGYAMRGGVGAGTEQWGEAAAGTRVSMREAGSAGNGPGARSRTGAAVGPTGQRAFPKGDAGRWLESLKDVDGNDSVAVTQLCQKCWVMDEEEAAELLARCGEIMALQHSDDWEGKENFPDSDIVESLAQQVALRLAGLSPTKALKLIKESEALLDDNDVMSMAFGAIADADPALALAEMQGLEDRSAAAEGAMARLLAADDLFNAASLLELMPDDYNLLSRFLERAVQNDPDLALAKGMEQAEAGNEYVVGLLVRSPATSQRTVEWAMALQGSQAALIRVTMIGGLAEKDLPQAREVYSRLAAGMTEKQRTVAAAKIAATMARTNEPWEPWLESLDEKSRQAALMAVVRAEENMSKRNIVTPGLSSGSDDAPAGPGDQAPSRAEELLVQSPASREKSDFIASKALYAMNSSLNEAQALVAQMPEGPEKVWLTREIELKSELKLLQRERTRAKAQMKNQETTSDDP